MREKRSKGDIRRVNGMAGKGGGPEELNGSEVSPKEGVAAVTLGDSRGSGRNRGKSELSRVLSWRIGPVGIKRGPTDLMWSPPPRLQWGVKSRDASKRWWGSRASRVDQLGSPATRGSLTEKYRESRTNVRSNGLFLFLFVSLRGPATKTEFAPALYPSDLLEKQHKRATDIAKR